VLSLLTSVVAISRLLFPCARRAREQPLLEQTRQQKRTEKVLGEAQVDAFAGSGTGRCEAARAVDQNVNALASREQRLRKRAHLRSITHVGAQKLR